MTTTTVEMALEILPVEDGLVPRRYEGGGEVVGSLGEVRKTEEPYTLRRERDSRVSGDGTEVRRERLVKGRVLIRCVARSEG
jgi:hypothetical protein